MRQAKRKRPHQLNIRLSEEEHDRLNRASVRAKRAMADWARLRLLAAAPCAPEAPKVDPDGAT